MKLFGINFLLILITFLNTTIFCSIFPDKIKKSDYLFIIDIQNQKNYLYFKDTLIDSFDISTGSKNRYKGNREMPEGIWRLTEKISDKEIKRRFENRAEIYGPRLISLEKFNDTKNNFIKTNRAFHGTNEPQNIGKPTSMGCVYHYNSDIKFLYSFIPKNTLVISTNEPLE